MKTAAYQERTYRRLMRKSKLVSFEARVEETDLHVQATRNLKGLTLPLVRKYREDIKRYGGEYPMFLRALTPLEVAEDAPAIVQRMADDARVFGVGPMAAVAGAIAEFVGRDLSGDSKEVVVENGGDIFYVSESPLRFSVFAGDDSPFSRNLVFETPCSATGRGVCTSSGTVGHSLSFGNSAAAVVIARSASLADAAATAIGNMLKSPLDIELVLAREKEAGRVDGLVLVVGKSIGLWGGVMLV